MAQLPEGSSNDTPRIESPQRQLTTQANKLERVSQHARGLVQEISEWAELRIKLVQVDLQGKLEEKKIQIGLGVAMGLLAFFGVLFLLTSIALGVGSWLGHPAWGFLVVTVFLFAMVGVLQMIMKKKVAGVEEKVAVEEEKLTGNVHAKRAA